jgi:hypothetical protein
MKRQIPGRRMIFLAAIAALAVGTAAFASGSAVPVTLRVVAGSNGLNVGQPARFVATARLPRGSHLLIQAFHSGRAPAKVAECLRSPCSGTYRDSREEAVAFQASAIKRVGSKITIQGRSKRVSVFWRAPAPPPPPPPPPSPPPAATPGHYAGKTADNELFAFDIRADGLSLVNLQTGQINESCDPTGYLSGGNLSFAGPIPVATDGGFAINTTINFTFQGNPGQDAVKITGHVTGGTASGTYRVDTSLTLSNGQGLNCSSGDQTWTASRTG